MEFAVSTKTLRDPARVNSPGEISFSSFASYIAISTVFLKFSFLSFFHVLCEKFVSAFQMKNFDWKTKLKMQVMHFLITFFKLNLMFFVEQ